ncbi:MAG: PcfJ domain-containing protein [SAR324 cluster bacterium]|nr:PcfJ domain-containing protein [SAR324 cluster bacterium]
MLFEYQKISQLRDQFFLSNYKLDAATGSLRLKINNTHLKLSSWEKGFSLFYQTAARRWEPVPVWKYKKLELERLQLFCRETNETLRFFLSAIPPEVREPCIKFEWLQYPILSLARYDQDMIIPFVRHHPVLFWLIINHTYHHSLLLSQQSGLLYKKRIDILQAIYGKSSKSTLKFIDKIQPEHYDRQEMSFIDRAVRTPEVVINLRHAKQVPTQILGILIGYSKLRCWSMISKALQNESFLPVSFTEFLNRLTDTLRMGEWLKIENYQEILVQCKNWEQLKILHDQWVQKLNAKEQHKQERHEMLLENIGRKSRELEEKERRRKQNREILDNQHELQRQENVRPSLQNERKKAKQEKDSEIFPPPPIAGIPGVIEPITCRSELAKEGLEMKNCLASYTHAVAEGKCYIYKVLFPERASLEIRISKRKNSLQIGQFECADNTKPSKQSKRFVMEWLQSSHTPLC